MQNQNFHYVNEGLPELPSGWSASPPLAEDVPGLLELQSVHEITVRGGTTASRDSVAAEVLGLGAQTRVHMVVRDFKEQARGWATVHDRAAGRTSVWMGVDPRIEVEQADAVAGYLLAWVEDAAREFAKGRDVSTTQLDGNAFEGDERQHRWFTERGYKHVRSWLQMLRPVTDADLLPGALPMPRDGVTIRRVRREEGQMPSEDDVRIVHQMLEESFADHFNSYRESFPEFVARQRELPGHRWDHWWVAELDGRLVAPEEGREDFGPGPVPAGAVVSTIMPGGRDDDGAPLPDGTYLDYIGVHRRARGRGVAKGLLGALIRDAAQRGRNKIKLEVDADSPTGADGLYRSMGWETSYVTQSWHRDLSL